MKPKLIIFDCDGVLIDSEPLACAVQAEAMTAAGYPISAESVAARFIGRSAADMRAIVEAETGRPLPADHEARCASALAAAFRRHLTAIPGMAALVGELAGSGEAICVASSSALWRVRLALDLVGLRRLFEPHLFTAAMVARGKPAPDLFLFAAAAFATPPAACLVIEDSVAGIEAARAAGMTVFGFTAGSHCDRDHAARLTAAGALAVHADAAALRAALLTLVRG